MDMDMLKSASEEEMDMLMMMQIDKLSELCGEIPDFPALALDTTTNTNTSNFSTIPQYQNSQFFINPQSHSQSSSNNITPQFNHQNYLQPNSQFNHMGRVAGEYNVPSSSQKRNSMAAMREMIFRIAAMQPIHIDPESVKPPKRRNVKISKDPQSVAARHRRERISERIRILQRLVPGGTKMDTASMLDEAIHYVKFLKSQVQSLERAANGNNNHNRGSHVGLGFPVAISNESSHPKAYHHH